ncbi:MAG: TerC family protein [Dehalococcoidales bacterium]|nr:TerC family protein [Dehalococcoidales bacterium]
MDYSIFPWVLFNVFLVTMLALDLFVFHRKAHVIKVNEALKWAAVWVVLAVAFGVFIHFWRGGVTALDYFSAYIVEKSLSVDNLFVILMFFTYFCVPQEYRHRVLFWGILGALVMRAVFILAGITLIENIHWIIYVFGAFLIFTGIKMGSKKDENPHPEANPVIKLMSRFLPMTKTYHGGKFFIMGNGRRLATPLFTVLVAIEATDIIFAVDSIPAVLAITTDPFIVYTSNMFAIMGLRSLYFALSGFAERMHYLHYGLAAVLVFLGAKMLISDIYEIPTIISLLTTAAILSVSVIASLRRRPQPEIPSEQLVCPPDEGESGS